jgi:tRNA pseudouridine55 synthase
VAKTRRLAQTKKVGHLGTLDPMATGVLPLVIGGATRLSQFYVRSSKTYEAIVRFGFSTNTYDAEGEPAGSEVTPAFTRDDLERWLPQFRGTFLQTPPPVSAKKIGGVRAYQLARKNIAVEIPPVEVTVSRLEILSFDLPQATLVIDCSAGTYVRRIAHDLGSLAGCGAHLSGLIRTRSGEFHLDRALSMERLEQMAADELLPDFPIEHVDDVTAGQIRHGRDFRISPFRSTSDAKFVKAVNAAGELIAIGELRLPQVYHPVLVL